MKRHFHGCRVAFTAILVGAGIGIASSFPNGAGGCGARGPAVGGSHFDFINATSSQEGNRGTLFEAATVVWMNGIQREPNVSTALSTGEDIELKIEAFQVAMRGVLIRIEALDSPTVDLTSLVTSDSNLLQPATACNGTVVGWTHVNASEKSVVSVSLRLDTAANITIDVTTVYANTDRNSVFAYSRYLVAFESEFVRTDAVSSSPAPALPVPPALPVSPTLPPPVSFPVRAISPTAPMTSLASRPTWRGAVGWWLVASMALIDQV